MRAATWPLRAPPHADPMVGEFPLELQLIVLVIWPKAGELMSMFGSPRLLWFSMSLKVASRRICTPSVTGKTLLSPEERLTKPGPTIDPALRRRSGQWGWDMGRRRCP